MGRINLAYAHGGAVDQGGPELFKETVAHNLGLPVDYTLDYRVFLSPDHNPCLDYLGGPPSGVH